MIYFNYYLLSADPWRACPGSGDAGACERLQTTK